MAVEQDCMEECAELIPAIGKPERFNPEDPNNKVGRNGPIKNLTEKMAEIYGLKFGDVRRMIRHEAWRMKRRMEAQGAEL